MCLNLPRFCGSTEPEFLSQSKVQWFEISIIKKNYRSNIFPGSKMFPPQKKGRLVLAGLSPAPEKGAFPTSIWVNGHSSPTMPTWSIMTLSWRQTFEVRSGEDVVACESRPWINTYPVSTRMRENAALDWWGSESPTATNDTRYQNKTSKHSSGLYRMSDTCSWKATISPTTFPTMTTPKSSPILQGPHRS